MGPSGDTRIQLCGRIVVELEGRRVEGSLPGRQGRLLFVCLATNRIRPTPRAELIEALWPGETPAGVDSALSALLSRLRRVLGGPSLQGRSEIRLALPPCAWIDLEAAAEAIHEAESAVALGEWARAWAPARIAYSISSRGFLPGEEAPWIEERRRSLEDIRLRSLECIGLAGLALGGPELAAAERSGRALIEATPYREIGYRLTMETLAARGEAPEALRVHDRLRRLLRDELGMSPRPATQALHRRLLQVGVLPAPARPDPPPPPNQPPPPPAR